MSEPLIGGNVTNEKRPFIEWPWIDLGKGIIEYERRKGLPPLPRKREELRVHSFREVCEQERNER